MQQLLPRKPNVGFAASDTLAIGPLRWEPDYPVGWPDNNQSIKGGKKIDILQRESRLTINHSFSSLLVFENNTISRRRNQDEKNA
jgi:hypothetical protein